MRFTVHRGTHEVGGSCVEVSTANTRIMFDVGLPLDGRECGLDVPGMFSAGPKVHGIFLSHAHMDHCGMLPKVRADIPVYMSKGTEKMLMAGSIFARQRTRHGGKQHELKAGLPCRVGDIQVTPYAVDHSAFDAMSFLVEADGKRLLYSGDLRLHGRKPGMAQELRRAVMKDPLDCLLMEGTNLGSGCRSVMSENELEAYLVKEIDAAPGLVLAAFSPMHVDRLVTFYRAARKAGRVLVLDAYGAFVMHLASGQARIPRPTPCNGVSVLYTGSFLRLRRRLQCSALKSGKRVPRLCTLFDSSRIEVDTIFGNPERYVMLFRPSMLAQDFGGKLPRAVTCFYSYWRGYLDRPEWQQARGHIGTAGGRLIEAHTSGHIFAEDIEGFVRELRPRVVVAVHTSKPEQYLRMFSNALWVNDGKEITI